MTRRKKLGILMLIAVTAVCLCSMKTSHENWLSDMHKREARKITSSVTLTSYRPAQKNRVQTIIARADQRIRKTDSISEAEAIRTSALKQIQSIKTDAQLTREEKAAREKARKRRLAKEKAKKRAAKKRAAKAAASSSAVSGTQAGSGQSSSAQSSAASGSGGTSARNYSSSSGTGSSGSSYSGHAGKSAGSSHAGSSGSSSSHGKSSQSNGSSSKGCVGDDASNFY